MNILSGFFFFLMSGSCTVIIKANGLLFVFLQVVVVQAISALCQKYPRKHSVMMTFLSNMLRDDVGGLLLNRWKLLSNSYGSY